MFIVKGHMDACEDTCERTHGCDGQMSINLWPYKVCYDVTIIHLNEFKTTDSSYICV